TTTPLPFPTRRSSDLMLPDDDAVRDVVIGRADLGIEGLALGLMPGAIHLSMSTISTATASRLASEHAHHGQGYVAAPVFGNPDRSEEHTSELQSRGQL